MSRSFNIDPAVRFTAGAVGKPGERTFLVQARSEAEYCTLLCEKEQVSVLAGELARVLQILPEGEEDAPPSPYDLELVEPLDAEWRVGAISLEYEPVKDDIVITFKEFVPADPETGEPVEEESAEARIVVSRGQVRAMAEHTAEVVASGRPRCEICHQPREEDHKCPGMNGHARP